MNNEIDLSLAIQLQAQFEEELRVRLIKESEEAAKTIQAKGFQWSPKNKELPEPKQSKLSVSLIDPSWELLDPNPDIRSLFLTFNDQFFWGRLSAVEVKWSPRMTLCAGVCSYEGRGGFCSVRLSVPLLKLRPRKDLVETLLHEMIHAYLFVTHNNRDHDGHGPNFHKHMYRINRIAGTNITVYHSFHDEVAIYKQHVWQCSGPCRKRPPYYGLVKRSMNRVPGPNDRWWGEHQRSCGGSYSKIKEPEGYGQKKRKISQVRGDNSNQDIRKFLNPHKKASSANNEGTHTNAHPPIKANDLSRVKTLGAPSSGRVKALDIQNASRSNVHGFGGPSGDPMKGQPRANSNQKPKGGATAIKMATGSRTMVVKGKKVDEQANSVGVSSDVRTPFGGKGYTLGGSGQNQCSRLISLGSTSNRVTDSDASRSSGCESPTEFDQRGSTKCPLCSSVIPETDFEEHISTCIGDFDSEGDDDFEIPSGSRPTAPQTTSSDPVYVIDDDDDVPCSTGNSPEDSKMASCPICNLSFSSGVINEHANSHFS